MLSQIARGGMSTVYLATDIRLDRTVALKVMHRSFAEDPGFVARFEREAKAAAKLSHPNVVGVFDQGSYDGLVFLVMEYVPGHTLRDVIRAHGALEPARALGVLDQVLLALTAAHDAGFVHRDIKPENVLITEQGVAKVADFGLARALTGAVGTATSQGLIIGTVAYLSPEQVAADTVDERSDVYSAGVMLFELLTGGVPFTAATPLAVAYRHVNEVVPAPSSAVAEIPDYVDALVLTATAKDPAKRFGDAWEFERALVRAQNRVMEDQDGDESADWGNPSPSWAPAPLPAAVPGQPADDGPTEVIAAGSSTAILVDHLADPTTVNDAEDPVTEVLGPRPAPLSAGRGSAVGLSPPDRTEPYRPSKKIKSSSRGRRSLFIAIILLLAALAGGVGWYLGSVEYVSVPDVTGQNIDDANVVLAESNLSIEEAGVESSESVPEGLLIRTDPPVGERAKAGSTIAGIVSGGPQLFQVPTLRGTGVPEATAAVEAAGFAVGGVERVYDPEVERDLLVGTVPPAESAQRAGTPITLVVSQGLEPVVLPDLIGQTAAQAGQRAANLGLLSTVREEFSDTAPAGTVAATEPTAGATMVPGDSLALVVSKGPAPSVVPDVVGMGQAEATAALQAAGLRVVSRNQFPIVVLDRVYSQDPPSGTELPRGSSVTISIV